MELKYIIIICAVVFILLIFLGLAVVNYSTEEMVEKFKKLTDLPVGTTPFELYSIINQHHFGGKINVKFKDEYFCDSFNGGGTLTLSSKYANEQNFGGLAICAHELGHAFQFKDQKNKMIKHAKITRFSKFISFFTTPLVVIGIIALILSHIYVGYALIGAGAFCFLVAIISKIAIIGIEKDASNKALEILRDYANFTDDELKIAKKFLNSAKQTYVADLLKIMLKWTMLVKK